MKHSHDRWFLFAFLVVSFLLLGCSAPKETLAAADAARKAQANYVRSSDEIVRQVLASYELEARAHLDYVFKDAIGRATGPDGKLAAETAVAAIRERDRVLAEIADQKAKAEGALAKAKLDVYDSEAFSQEVRAYLAGSGVTPETARALGDMLEERLTNARR